MELRANIFFQIILYSLLVDTKVRCLLRTRRESTGEITSSVRDQAGQRHGDNILEGYGYDGNVNSNLNVNANGNDNQGTISYRRSFTSVDRQRGKSRGYNRNVNININRNENF